MKKVKIMLAATLVVAAVGGALAFKAAKLEEFYCSDTPFYCPNLVPDLTTTTIDYNPNLYCSTEETTWCPIRVKSNK